MYMYPQSDKGTYRQLEQTNTQPHICTWTLDTIIILTNSKLSSPKKYRALFARSGLTLCTIGTPCGCGEECVDCRLCFLTPHTPGKYTTSTGVFLVGYVT